MTKSKSTKKEKPITIKALLEYNFTRMKWGGVGPKSKQVILCAIYGKVLWILSISTVILQGLYLINNSYEEEIKMMYDVGMLFGVWQLVMKTRTLIVKSKQIESLINTNENNFWSLNNLTSFQQNEIQYIYKITKIIIRSYRYAIRVTVLGHIANSYLRGKNNLIFNIWIPEFLKDFTYTTPGRDILCIIQCMVIYVGDEYHVVECDSLFIILIASVIAQLKMLKYKLKLISSLKSDEENITNLKEIIILHQIIYKFIEEIDNIFSHQLIQVIGSNMIVAVISLFVCLTEDKILKIWEYVFFLLCIAIQIFVYCYIGQLIQNETLTVAEEAYGSDWAEIVNKEARFMILMIINKAQKQATISMGGVFILCLETFSEVTKTMFSFLTFMLNVQASHELN